MGYLDLAVQPAINLVAPHRRQRRLVARAHVLVRVLRVQLRVWLRIGAATWRHLHRDAVLVDLQELDLRPGCRRWVNSLATPVVDDDDGASGRVGGFLSLVRLAHSFAH